MNRIHTLADTVAYFQERARQTEQELLEAEQHWTRQLPPNVKLDPEGKVSLTKPPVEGDGVPPRAELPPRDDPAPGAEEQSEGASAEAPSRDGARAPPQ